MTKYLLETNKIAKRFTHRNGILKIFDNVSIKIKAGELIALVGPSGSGKSSLLHMLSLIEPPTSGHILFKGQDSRKFTDEDKNEIRKNNISMIFQENNLLSDFTAIENVLMPLLIQGKDYDLSKKTAKKILKEVNLIERINHFPSELSGGEQQRVAIARALITKADLILADEPTGNLDFRTSKDIFSYFLKLKKLNKAVLFATHNRELASKADYKLSIFDGKIKRVNV
tara:strand:- start:459 stop:1142 length:684 start_codon:yes stop_codon:yes gene_type:complete